MLGAYAYRIVMDAPALLVVVGFALVTLGFVVALFVALWGESDE